MKAITEKVWSNAANAWGRYADSAVQVFEIELSDVGQENRNYKGHNHSTYTFKSTDVGRHVHVCTDNSYWTCFVFATGRSTP